MLLLSTRVSNGLDPYQEQHSVHPDLGQNCLQSLSAADKFPLARKEIKYCNMQVASVTKGKNSDQLTKQTRKRARGNGKRNPDSILRNIEPGIANDCKLI